MKTARKGHASRAGATARRKGSGPASRATPDDVADFAPPPENRRGSGGGANRKRPRGKPFRKGTSGNRETRFRKGVSGNPATRLRKGTPIGTATRFAPGRSGNPGGRPKSSREIVDLARMTAPEGIEVLLSIMRNPQARDADRITAVRELHARGYGRPSVSIVVHAAEEAPSDLRPVIESMSEEEIRRFLGLPSAEPLVVSRPVLAPPDHRNAADIEDVVITPVPDDAERT